MAETSRFWDGAPGAGDGSVAPYDAGTEFSEVMVAVSGMRSSPNRGGVIAGGLITTIFAANTVRVAAGEAIVYGTWYRSDANVDITVPSPSGATRVDRIILRKSWSTQTVRLVRLAGTEGAGAPALTQTVGVTWEIPVYQASITTGGVITLTDSRESTHGVRDTLWFGPIGTGLLDTSIQRTQAGTFRFTGATNTILEVRAATGIQSARFGQVVPGGRVDITSNASHDGVNWNLDDTSVAGAILQVTNSTPLGIAFLPAGANPASPRIKTFLGVGATGTLTVTPDATQAGLVVTSANTVDPTAAIRISRVGPTTQNHWLCFGGGIAYDCYVGRRVNTDDLSFSMWNGVSLQDRMVLSGAGTLTINHPGVAAALNWAGGVGQLDISGANPRMMAVGATNLELYGNGGYVYTSVDGLINLGSAARRWATVFAATGTINTSIEEAKQDFEPLDSVECMQAILDTDWMRFMFKPPAPPFEGEGAPTFTDQTVEDRSAARAAHDRMLIETAHARRQKGYVLQSSTYKVHELFGLEDRASASPGSDLAVVACALQQALKDIAALKTAININTGASQYGNPSTAPGSRRAS